MKGIAVNPKKRMFMIAAMITISAVGIIFVTLMRSSTISYVAKVNGAPVTEREFRLFLSQNRASIIGDYAKKYGAEKDAGFWMREFDGETPAARIKEQSLQDLVRVKVLQIYAKEVGMQDNLDYSAFLSKLRIENERRLKAKQMGEVLYGPVQYNELEYYRYVFDALQVGLKNRLAEASLAAGDEGLRPYYESMKKERFRRADSIKVSHVYIPYRGASAQLGKEEAKARIEEVKERLDKGERFEELANASTRIFDESTHETDFRYEGPLLSEVQKLTEGQISEIVDIETAGREGGFYILKCLEKKSEGYVPFEEAKDLVRIQYADDQLTELTERLVRDAKVEVNLPVYDMLRLD